MLRFELQIEAARRASLNRDYSTTLGIPQEDFVVFGNEAQERIVSEIKKTHPKYFIGQKIVTCVAGQEAYDLPSDCYVDHIENVEFSADGRSENYIRLEQAKLPERVTAPASEPRFYIKFGRQILLAAPCQNSVGTLRISYFKQPRRLEVRRATVASATFSTPTLSALSLSTLTMAALDPSNELSKYNYLTVVDRIGRAVMSGIEYDNASTLTGLVTLTGGSFTAQTGETIAVGNFVVPGVYSTNVSELPDVCERYIIKWMTAQALARDGSSLASESEEKCKEMLQDIVTAFADSDHDVSHVTILTTDFMDFGNGWI